MDYDISDLGESLNDNLNHEELGLRYGAAARLPTHLTESLRSTLLFALWNQELADMAHETWQELGQELARPLEQLLWQRSGYVRHIRDDLSPALLDHLIAGFREHVRAGGAEVIYNEVFDELGEGLGDRLWNEHMGTLDAGLYELMTIRARDQLWNDRLNFLWGDGVLYRALREELEEAGHEPGT